MEKFEKNYKDLFENIDFEESKLKGKVIEAIKREKKKEVIMGRAKTILTLVLVSLFAISFVVPVFGKSGTLPQVIKSIKITSLTKNYEGVIEIDDETLQKIENANLNFQDAVVISALAKEKGIDVDKVVQLRSEGYSWGKILDSLSKTEEVVNTLKNKEDKPVYKVTSTNEEQNQNKIEEKNKGKITQAENKNTEQEKEQNENLIVVIKGKIESINDSEIVVDSEKIKITEQTIIKKQNDQIKFGDLKKDSDVLVHAENIDNVLFARDILVFDKNNGKQKSESKEENKENNKEFELLSTITSIQGNIITLKDFENPVVITLQTKIEKNSLGQVGIDHLKEGIQVQIHIRYDGTNYNATNIVITKLSKEKGNQKSEVKDNKGKKP